MENTNETAAEADFPSVDEAKAQLDQFFANNPAATMEANPDGGFQIVRPWNDPSLVFDAGPGDDFEQLAGALNAVSLPDRFSALWHRESRKLEVIWTALKLPADQQEIAERTFEFRHRGVVHVCEFGKSSAELMTIAPHTVPVTISDTNYRNMVSFASFDDEDGNPERFDHPKSFWIDNVDLVEDDLVDLILHLNFYLQYFDSSSPIVVVHPKISEKVTPQRTRYLRGKFPSVIDSKVLDENMLSFWSFAFTGNPMLRFLLYYRVLEYAAVHTVTDEVREALKKLLLSPDVRSDLNATIGSITAAFAPMGKFSDTQRLRALFRKTVDPALLWRDLKANRDFFMKDTVFDGGFTVRAPIGKNDSDGTFDARGVEQVADRFRDIRNALSHGKDLETSGVIRPTPQNAEMFRPWVHLIATAAGEVVLYQEAT